MGNYRGNLKEYTFKFCLKSDILLYISKLPQLISAEDSFAGQRQALSATGGGKGEESRDGPKHFSQRLSTTSRFLVFTPPVNDSNI